jgi:hypothetical protein
LGKRQSKKDIEKQLAIKKIRIKFDIIINQNQIIRDEIEN